MLFSRAMPDPLKALKKLKYALLSTSFVEFTDASKEGVGAMLVQLNEEEYDYPIYYTSKQLILVEMNYTITKRKKLGVMFALNFFFIILT